MKLLRSGFLLLLLCMLAAPAQAQEEVRFFSSFTVESGRSVQSAVCIFCSVHIQGEAREVVAIFGRVIVDGHVQQDAVSIGGGVIIRGSVGQDAVSVGGHMEVDGPVRDAVTVAGRLRLLEGARVQQNAVGIGGVDRHPGATVGRDVVSIAGFLGVMGFWGLLALLLFLSFIPMLLITVIVYAILGEPRTLIMASAIQYQPGPTLLTGLGGAAATAALAFAFSFAGGISLVFHFVLAAVVGLTLLVGLTGVAMWVGRKAKPTGSAWGAVILGVLLLVLLQLVPLVGSVVNFFLVLLSLGSALLTGWGSGHHWLRQQIGGREVSGPAGA